MGRSWMSMPGDMTLLAIFGLIVLLAMALGALILIFYLRR